jgi:hypothetical protein
MTYDEICDRLSAQFGSENNATIRAVVNEKQREMLAMSEYRGATPVLGTTAAGVVQFALSDGNVESYRLLRVGTAMYRRVNTATLWELQDPNSGTALTGPGGVFAQTYSDDGNTQYIELYPEPATAGQAIEVLDYAWVADAVYGAGTALSVPLDLHSKLLSGCRSYLFREVDERQDLAPAEEQDFQAGIAELSARKRRRVGGGPARARVSVGGR